MRLPGTPCWTALIAAMLVLSIPPIAGADEGPNDEQRGENSYCLDHTVYQGTLLAPLTDQLWLASDVSPLAAVVDVDPGTWYEATVDGPLTDTFENQGGEFNIHFWDADGASVASMTSTHGLVPQDAAIGTICIMLLGLNTSLEAPNPFATWTYQDGYESPFYGNA